MWLRIPAVAGDTRVDVLPHLSITFSIQLHMAQTQAHQLLHSMQCKQITDLLPSLSYDLGIPVEQQAHEVGAHAE